PVLGRDGLWVNGFSLRVQLFHEQVSVAVDGVAAVHGPQCATVPPNGARVPARLLLGASARQMRAWVAGVLGLPLAAFASSPVILVQPNIPQYQQAADAVRRLLPSAVTVDPSAGAPSKTLDQAS